MSATDIIATLALIVSIVTYYLSSLTPAKLSLSAGEWIVVRHSPGSLYIYVPVVFQNGGAQAGAVRSLGLVLRHPQTEEAIFLRWNGVVKPEQKASGSWMWESNGTPLTVPAGELAKMIEFYDDGPCADWTPDAVTYQLTLLAWTSDDAKATVKVDTEWDFPKEYVSRIQNNLKLAKHTAEHNDTWVPSARYAPVAKMLSKEQCDELLRDSRFSSDGKAGGPAAL